MNIATALNRRYVNYTIVMLTSLCINNPEHIDAYLMHNELIDDDIIFLKKLNHINHISARHNLTYKFNHFNYNYFCG